jgi:hypothetical protein
MIGAPKTINGYPVVKSGHTPKRPATREGHVVLVDRGEDEAGPRYVVAWFALGDDSWWKGDYINDLEEAIREFGIRHERMST